MATQTVTTTFTAEAGPKSVTFAKPVANYGKFPGISISDALGGVGPYFVGADVDNGNGTMTATLQLTGSVTGTVETTILDKP